MPPSYDAGGSRSSLYYARLSKTGNLQLDKPGKAFQGVERAMNRVLVQPRLWPRHHFEIHIRPVVLVLRLHVVGRIGNICTEEFRKSKETGPRPNQQPLLGIIVPIIEETQVPPLSPRVLLG